jgi:non-heme Fe2+,alpha-ketoglutarate-dependent halogenase
MTRIRKQKTSFNQYRVIIMLTSAQIRHFHEQGWISPLPAFSPDEVIGNRASFERLRAVAADAYAINGAQVTCRSIWDIATHPALVAAVRCLLGDELVVWGTHYFINEAGDPRTVAWHQDGPYWPFTPMKTITAWVAIDDSDPENSAMRVVPGSHKLGVLAYRESRSEERNVLNRSLDGIDNLPAPQHVILRAGEFSLHHDLLVHGSEANRSTRRRCGLTVRYCTPDVTVTGPEKADWMKNAIRVSGDGPVAKGWEFPPQPVGDNLRRPEWVIGAN